MKHKIKIALADDHSIFRKGFISILQALGYNNIVFEAANAQEVLENLKSKKTDILFLDIQMPDTQGTQALEQVKKLYPKVKVIILSGHYREGLIVEFIKKGSSAFLSKDCDFPVLVKTIEAVYNTGFYYDDTIAALLSADTSTKSNEPSEREIEVIRLLCQGFSHRQIGNSLNISKRTVDTHRFEFKKKTGCKTLLDIEKYAKEKGIFIEPV